MTFYGKVKFHVYPGHELFLLLVTLTAMGICFLRIQTVQEYQRARGRDRETGTNTHTHTQARTTSSKHKDFLH